MGQEPSGCGWNPVYLLWEVLAPAVQYQATHNEATTLSRLYVSTLGIDTIFCEI